MICLVWKTLTHINKPITDKNSWKLINIIGVILYLWDNFEMLIVLASERYAGNWHIFKRLSSLTFPVKLPSGEYHSTLSMKSWYWSKQWLGAIRQQGITLTKVGHVLCHHMALQRTNELNHIYSADGHIQRWRFIKLLLVITDSNNPNILKVYQLIPQILWKYVLLWRGK